MRSNQWLQPIASLRLTHNVGKGKNMNENQYRLVKSILLLSFILLLGYLGNRFLNAFDGFCENDRYEQFDVSKQYSPGGVTGYPNMGCYDTRTGTTSPKK